MIIQLKFCLFIIFLMYTQVTNAQQNIPIVVGVEDSQYLPHYAVKDGVWVGFGAALLEEFSSSSGFKLDYRAMPVERLYRSFLSGEVDLKYPDNPEWRKDLKQGREIIYSLPIVGFVDGVSVLAERYGQGIDKISVLGTLRGFTPVSWQQRVKDGHVKIQESDSLTGLIKQVLIGRVDGIYANIDVVQHRLLEITHDSTALRFDNSLPFLKAHYRLSSIKEHRIIEEFNQWMENNQALIHNLKIKYFREVR